MKKLISTIAGLTFVLTLGGFAFKPAAATAAKVDCAKVMEELNSGKKVKVVAQDLKISTSSVYRCRRRARAANGHATVPSEAGAATHMSGSMHTSTTARPMTGSAASQQGATH